MFWGRKRGRFGGNINSSACNTGSFRRPFQCHDRASAQDGRRLGLGRRLWCCGGLPSCLRRLLSTYPPIVSGGDSPGEVSIGRTVLTPAGKYLPQIVVPPLGTYLNIGSFVAGKMRWPSLITACRYGMYFASFQGTGSESSPFAVFSSISCCSFCRH